MPTDVFHQHLNTLRSGFEKSLERCVAQTRWPPTLEDAVRYSLLAGGKRLRPILVLLSCQLFGGDTEIAMPAACAIEMVHTYSLVHDDLPAMDDDNYRRGRLTSHRIYGEAMAILAGDCLLTEAFRIVLNSQVSAEHRIEMIRILSSASGGGGMVGGQVLDLEGERGPLRGPDFSERGGSSGEASCGTAENADFSAETWSGTPNFFAKATNSSERNRVDELTRIHTMKTGALICGALELGAVAAAAGDEDRSRLREYGYRVGLAFQIADDLLDVTGDQSRLGKTPGRDADLGKLTYPALWGIEESRQRATTLITEACKCLDQYGDRAVWLKQLAQFIVERDH